MITIANLDLDFFQMDVKTTFLYEEINEEVYKDQPNGFQVNEQEHKVCRLRCSIYGLK